MQYPTHPRSASAHVELLGTTNPEQRTRLSPPASTHDASVIHHAKHLLWQRLQIRQLGGFRFFEQMRIPPYHVDFVCLSRRVVVEVVDPGSIDPMRYQILEDTGYQCLRFLPGDIVERIDEVLSNIRQALTLRL